MKKSSFISKEIAIETCKISGAIRDNGLRKKKILIAESDNYQLYENIVKTPMAKIRDKFGDSATISARKFLDNFIDEHPELTRDNYAARGFTFLGRVLNSYTWACIAKKDESGKAGYKNNPQLYITFGKMVFTLVLVMVMVT